MAKIRRRGDKWMVDYRIAGIRHRPLFQNKAEAETFKRNLLLRDLDDALGYVEVKETTLAQAVTHYLDKISSGKGQRTKQLEEGYFEIMKVHLGEDEIVSRITLLHLQGLQRHLAKKVVNATVNRYFNTYKNFFNYCEDWEFTPRNPARKLRSLKEKKYVPKIWDEAQVSLAQSRVPKWARAAMRFEYLTGLRQSEVRRAKREDFDAKNRTLKVGSWKGGGDEDIRYVPLVQEAYEILVELLLSHSSKYIFVNSKGEPLGETTLSTAISKAAKKVGLQGYNQHGLRHTLASRLAREDVHVRKIQVLLGHKNIKTTQRYLTVDTEDVRGALENVLELRNHGHQRAPNMEVKNEKEAK